MRYIITEKNVMKQKSRGFSHRAHHKREFRTTNRLGGQRLLLRTSLFFNSHTNHFGGIALLLHMFWAQFYLKLGFWEVDSSTSWFDNSLFRFWTSFFEAKNQVFLIVTRTILAALHYLIHVLSPVLSII